MTMIRMATAAMAASMALAGPTLAAEPMITGVAVYEVGLDPSKGAGLATISGTMEAKVERVCDAYVTEATLDAELTGPDGSRVPLDVVSHHRESADTLEFEVSTSLADVEVDAASGTARREPDSVVVALDEPRADTLVLPGKVLFPMAMLEAVIAAAKAGETFVQFNTFDGTGKGMEVWTVSVLITPAAPTADEDEAMFVEGLGFDDLAHWRMALSYFPPGSSGEQMPAFSTSMVVYENGFAQAAVYDLGQFAMRLKLTEFRPIAPKPCP
jgi:hypothetical protein